MGDPIDLKEFLSAYLAEAEEHLSGANASTLAIESAARNRATDARAVRELFRLLHTLKGLSAMVGVESIVSIAHRLESIVRSATTTSSVIDTETLEAIFEGLRVIGARLQSLAEGKEPPSPPAALIERLDVIAKRSQTSAREVTTPPMLNLDAALLAKVAPYEQELLVKGAESGRRALRAEFVPTPKKAAEGLTVNSVRERVASIAEIIKVIPVAQPTTENAPGGLTFVILVLTSVEDIELAAAVGCDVDSIQSLAPASPSLTRVADRGVALTEDGWEPTASSEPAHRNVLRVETSKVDDAMDRFSALIVTRSRLARVVDGIDPSSPAGRELRAIVIENSRQLRDMRAAILSIRMIPFGEVLSRLPLVVRGVKRTSGKEVELVTESRDTELDKAVAERIFPALVHLVRNAVDHGIEPPDERVRFGKRREGTVSVLASARSNHQLVVEISDDGRGVDRASLARSSGQEIGPGDAALLEVLCRPGLSTRTEVTTTSGRGMGMDIVRKIVVEQLGGELTLESVPGSGSTFRIQVPLTVAIVDAFTVQSGDDRFAVPVGHVDEIVEIRGDEQVVRGPSLASGGAVNLIERRGVAMPLLDLSRILRPGAASTSRGARVALVIRRGADFVAFGLERVLAQQETVVRPLIDPLVQVPGIAGSTDLGDGRLTLVLDLISLVAGLRHGSLQESAAAQVA